MTLIVSVDMYSGLPNPTWELSEEQFAQLKELLSTEREPTPQKSSASTGKLGYRGLRIEAVNEVAPLGFKRVFDGILDTGSSSDLNLVDADSRVEEFLIETAGSQITDDERSFIREEIRKNVSGGVANALKSFDFLAAPPFNPAKWNADPNIRTRNNCYNYANDKITNTFAQPGRGSGAVGPYPPSCPGTGQAAERDGQISIPNPDLTPAEGQIVALVVSTTPGFFDYHWYRRDENNMWSHKPGQTAATNRDNTGNPISDPRICDRGPYNLFCGFYHCIPSKTKIQ